MNKQFFDPLGQKKRHVILSLLMFFDCLRMASEVFKKNLKLRFFDHKVKK